MCSRVVLHVTAIRVYIPSLLPSSSSSKGQGHTKEHELYLFLPPCFVVLFLCPFPSSGDQLSFACLLAI
jgi:hypothetical protein